MRFNDTVLIDVATREYYLHISLFGRSVYKANAGIGYA